MKRVGKTGKFRQALAEAFLERLPGRWEIQGTPHQPRLVILYPWGTAGLQPKMTAKGYPSTLVSFSYGISFTGLSPLLAKLCEASGFKPADFFDVYQDTVNRPLPGKERRSHVANYSGCDFGRVYDDLLGGAEGELLGFFTRFGDLREVRRSLEDEDGSFMDFGSAGVITAIDYLLDDVEHLRRFHARRRNVGRAGPVEDAARVLGMPLS
jgi:hypothetical protein